MARFPLAVSLGNRAGNLDKDSLMTNAFAEGGGDAATGQRVRAIKRPGLESAFTVATGTGQGIFTWTTPGPTEPEETLVVITDDIVNTSPTVLTKRLAWGVQPSTSNISDAITPAVTVRILSWSGELVSSSTATVVITMQDNATGATLGGDTSNAAVAGVATFNDLELNRSGSDFTLLASCGTLRTATSNPFSIPTELVFTTQPATAEPDEVLDPVIVESQDGDGTTDTNYTGSVTVSIYSGTSGAVLSGTVTKSAVAGAATFNDLSINLAGSYTLKATGGES